MQENNSSSPQEGSSEVDRRDFLSTASSLAMTGGLVASYGTLGYMAGRFLYPARGSNVGWLYVANLEDLAVGDSMTFRAPSGATVVIARHPARGTVAESFVALSSVCPHLGCQVHWEEQNDRFFCPCHNGVFDREGVATEGPPAQAKQITEAISAAGRSTDCCSSRRPCRRWAGRWQRLDSQSQRGAAANTGGLTW